MTPDIIRGRLFRPRMLDEFKERIRVKGHVRDGMMGFAIEVVRELHGQEYQYVGWVSAEFMAKDQVWVADQWAMCDRAFEATIKEIAN